MKRRRHSEARIIAVLKEVQAGAKVDDVGGSVASANRPTKVEATLRRPGSHRREAAADAGGGTERREVAGRRLPEGRA